MMVRRSNRFYSNRQEKKVAKAIGGKQTANSGATAFSKGDVRTDKFLIECKTCTSPRSQVTIKKEWLIKNEEEKFAMNKEYSALAFDFGDGDSYYVVNEKFFKEILKKC